MLAGDQTLLAGSSRGRRTTTRRAGIGRSAQHNLLAYLFLSPWLLGLVTLTAGPMAASLWLSFTDFELFGTPRWVGLANYVRMLTEDPRYLSAVRVTLTYVLWAVPLKLAFALVVALLLNRKLRGLGAYRAIYYLPSLLGGSVAIAIMWRNIFSYDGLVNQLLLRFGIDGPSWITHPDYALDTLIVLAVWQFGSPMVIFLAGLKQIPSDLYDAAAMDGANGWQRFWRITVPMLTPIIFFNLVMQMINAYQAFTPSFIISGGTGGPADSTLFYTLYIYEEGFTNFQMGYASAMAWVLVAAIACSTAVAFVSSRYWVFYGDGEAR